MRFIGRKILSLIKDYIAVLCLVYFLKFILHLTAFKCCNYIKLTYRRWATFQFLTALIERRILNWFRRKCWNWCLSMKCKINRKRKSKITQFRKLKLETELLFFDRSPVYYYFLINWNIDFRCSRIKVIKRKTCLSLQTVKL